MINTWNPAELNQKINQLEATIIAQDVEANPTGEATGTLTKVGIDGTIYALNDETTAAKVSYDNTSSGMTADDVQDAIDELNTSIGTLSSGKVDNDGFASSSLTAGSDGRITLYGRNADNSYTRVDITANAITVRLYDSEGTVTSQKSVTLS